MNQRDLVGAVARIWSTGADGQAEAIVGTGFLVAGRRVLTCAHVVAGAAGLEPNTPDMTGAAVLLDFPASQPGQLLTASVALWYPRVPRARGVYDIAGLELSADAPAAPVPLALLEEPWNRPCRVFGFPAGRPEGSYAEGSLKDVLANGLVLIRGGDDAREFVRKGYSGGPVYTAAGIVGMLTEGDASQRVREAAMIPVSALLEAWPELYKLSTECPYQGLASFSEATARFFCGREEASRRLLAAVVAATQPTLLAGASGSGKSSLVAAGLVPQLRALRTLTGGAAWEVCIVKPGAAPWDALAHALLGLWQPTLAGTALLSEQKQLSARLQRGELSAADVVGLVLGRLGAEQQLVVVVDQFEELFTLGPGRASGGVGEKGFLEHLAQLLGDPQTVGRVRLLLTVRTDFLDQLLDDPASASWHRQNGLIHYLGGVENLRDVIEKPLAAAGLGQFEEGLPARIVQDLAYEPNPLPLLEFTLTELWQAQQAGRLSHAAYDALGGVGQALARYAQATFDGLSAAQQAQAKSLFLQLLQPSDSPPDTRLLDTRLPSTRPFGTRRVALIGDFADEMRPLITLLADKRLIVTGRDSAQPGTLEIVHEALFEHWPLLRQWLGEGWAFRRWQEGLRVALRDWREHPTDDFLLQGAKLAAAADYLTSPGERLTPPEVAYIRASLELRERRAQAAQAQLQREARRQRRTNRVLLAALTVTLLFSGAAAWQWTRARSETSRAETFSTRLKRANVNLEASARAAQVSARRALASTLGARGLLATDTPSPVNGDAQLGALLAVHATAVDDTLASWSNLLRVVERVPLPESAVSPLIQVGPGGRLMAVSVARTVSLWDTLTRSKRAELPVVDAALALAFSPNGRVLATADAATGVSLWDTASGRALGEAFSGHPVQVVALRFTPDGRHLVSCSLDGSLMVWNVTQRTVAATLQRPAEVSPPSPAEGALPLRPPLAVLPSAEHQAWLGSLALAAGGRRLALAGGEGDVGIYTLPGLEPVAALATGLAVRALAFSPDGRRLAVGDRSGRAEVWSVRGQRRLGMPLTGLTSLAQTLAFSPGGRHLAAGDAAGNLSVWDLTTRAPLKNSPGFQADEVRRVAFGDRQLLVEAREGPRAAFWRFELERGLLRTRQDLRAAYQATGTVALQNIDRGSLRSPLEASPDSFLEQLVYSPTGTRFAVRTNSRTAQLWNAATRQPVAPPITAQPDIESLAFSPDGRYFVTGSRDGAVVFRDGLTGQALGQPLPLGIPRALSLSFRPGGSQLAVGTEGGVVVWDLQRERLLGQPEWDIPAPQRMDLVSALTYTPDGRWLVGGYERFTYVWDAASLKLVKRLPGMAEDRKVRSLEPSPDGTFMVAGYNDGWSAAVWAVAGWRHVTTLSDVASAAFSSEGNLLATGGSRTVSFRDARTLEPLGDPVEAHEAEVRALVFSPDGRTLISADTSLVNLFWQTERAAWRSAACARAGRNLFAAEWTRLFAGAAYRKTCPEFAADPSAVELLLTQARAAERAADARTLYHRAAAYAREAGNTELVAKTCSQASARLAFQDPRCRALEASVDQD